MMYSIETTWWNQGFFFGFPVPDCTKKNNLAKKRQKFVKSFARKLQIKETLGWNHQIVDENRIRDMWYAWMWYFLSNMWMNVEIWSTTIKFYIATLALRNFFFKKPLIEWHNKLRVLHCTYNIYTKVHLR